MASGGWGPDDCTIPTPQLTGTYSREKALSQTADLSVDWDNPYFDMIHKEWGASLRKVFNALPDPDWSQWPAEDPVSLPCIGVVA